MKRVLCALLIVTVWMLCGCGGQPEQEALPTATPAISVSREELQVSSEPTGDSPTPTGETTYPLVVTDLSGAQITIKSAGRIVSLAPSNTEIVVEEGGEDRLVGIDASSERIAPDVQIVGEYQQPDSESILGLSPDVVLAGNSLPDELKDALDEAGIAVVISEAAAFDQIEESFRLIGQIINEPEASEQLCAQLASTVEEVEAMAPAAPLSAFFILSFGEEGGWTVGDGSFVSQMMEYAGAATAAAGDSKKWKEYSPEEIAAADPDCIIVSSEAGDYAELSETPGYMNLRAVQDGLVFQIDANVITRPGPSVTEGLLALSGIIQAASEGPTSTAGLETSVAPE